MASRRPEGAALLVAGHGTAGAIDASMVHTLGQIGESLLATAAPWTIRRLSSAAGERYAADRGSLKQHLDELCADPVRVLVLVVLGEVVELPAGPALVTGTQVREYPEDATLPLAWIGERLRAAKAEQLLVVWSANGKGDTHSWLDALATGRPHDVIAVAATSDGCPLADALLGGLCGDALDPKTGTVTMRSISEHLSACVSGALLQVSTASATIAESPPLAGLWDVRRSQLATHTARTPLPTAEDLTGSVLPGRFRIDAIVARGTFGTVYRARQLAVERDVAVKVLHADIDPASEDGRLFVHEIRSVGRIDHRNVVRIHQADITHDGRLFFAMELLDGRDLQQLIADEPLPKAAALDLIRQLLAGLGAAHAAGLVHADVKPANALVVKRDDRDHLVLVDFGLARLRAPDRPALSAGGTPAYMAPEQLHDGRVDARSDLFSAALVLVALLTRWRRPNAHTLVPSLVNIDDASLRGVLERALALDPAKRYQTARALAEALTGGAPPPPPNVTQPTPFLPFHHLAALTERDRGRLHGRESDVAVLTEHVLYRRSVIYAAPSGTGKTSLLRAGLLPRLETLGIHAVYVRCRGADAAVAAAIWPAATSIEGAIAEHHAQRGNKLVLVLDQLEALDGASTLIHDVLAFDRWDADVSVVLSVREDHLARLLARTQPVEPGMAIVRLPPLRPAGARAAITGPLVEARLAIEPELLDALLEDLQRAAAAIGSEIGWGSAPAVFPPHLQLACSVLYEALGPGEATLTLAHYRGLGGFDAIVGEHLERVVDSELADGRDVIARDLFVALVTTAHERAMRPESELLDIVGAQHGHKRVLEVLELLRARGLLVRVRVEAGDPSWELVHDSLVPRVLAWVDRRDLARRRAVELVRYHLRRSQPAAPSLLGRAELREVRDHADAIAELETEMKKRGSQDVWTPRRLVARSLRSQRRRIAAAATLIALAATIAGISLYITFAAKARARAEQSMRDRDLGRFTLSLEPFDWDPTALRATPVSAAELPALRWRLFTVAGSPIGEPGAPFGEGAVIEGTPAIDGLARVEDVEAHGGPAFVFVEGRERHGEKDCGHSAMPIKLPGYALRSAPASTLHVRVPTCAASRADLITIPAGFFIFGGAGEPPSAMVAADLTAQESRVHVAAFAIDRTEVTNAALEVFAEATKIPRPSYPHTTKLEGADGPTKPVVGITWDEARAYCAFFGKVLPTSQQWQKALRGGDVLSDGTPNPMPRRTFPWGNTALAMPANIGPDSRVATVGSFPLDRSPYGVLDLAGNVSEWTATPGEIGMRIIRGGNYDETTADSFTDFVAIENRRPTENRAYTTGMRCAAN